MRHLAAYYDSVDLTGGAALIPAVQDQQLFTSGNDIRVSPQMPYLCAAAAFYGGTTLTQAQLNSPSLRTLAPYDIAPKITSFPTETYTPYVDRYDNPLELEGNESLNVLFDGTAGGASVAYAIVDFCDAPVKPVTGDVFTVGATGSAALVAGTWVNTGLVFDVVLPAGVYSVVGLRAEGANLVAARFVFIGQGNRPGVLAVQTSGQLDDYRSRNGYGGVFGAFDINQPPTIDCLGQTDTTQQFYLDLIKTK